MLIYHFMADLVVILHAAYVSFVVLGLVLILAGVIRGWNWVRNFYFRIAHLVAIAIVCIEAVSGIVCPLTTLEDYLREKGGQATYAGNFLGYWAHQLIFFDAPPWVFTFCYLIFGLLVLTVLLLAPPNSPRGHRC